MKTIIRYILSVILAIAIIVFFSISLASSTILKEQYVISKLEEKDYYNKMYEQVKSNFENYIYQSGLDENVIENIVTKEKIENDTKIILRNIYNGLNEKINTDEIRDNLSKKINESLGTSEHSQTQQKAIDTFIQHICKEYENTILHFNIEEQVNKQYVKIINYMDIVKKVLLVVIGIVFVAIIALSLRRIYKFVLSTGVASSIVGLFFIFVNLFITSKIKVHTITILNDSISEALRDILQEILSTVMNYGLIFLCLGIIFIISSNLVHYILKEKRTKEKNQAN